MSPPILHSVSFVALSLVLSGYAQSPTYSATYLPSNAPYQSEQGQAGYNNCTSGYSQTSECQNAYVNTVQDWCIWGPPQPGPDSVIGNTEQIEVAWCMQSGYGTRLIPDGSITGAHVVVTPDYVQVTGVGNLTNINIPAGDSGGELDPHGADGNGNPIGGLVFSSAFGTLEQIHEWTNFVADDQFCFRACKPAVDAPTMCQHIYDVMGCEWNMPANYSPGVFEQCLGDSAEPMGVYGTSTFYQGEPVTPSAHPIPSSSSCTFYSTISNGQGVLTGGITSKASTATATATVGTHHTSHFHHHSCFSDFCTSSVTISTYSDVPASLTLTSISPGISSSTLLSRSSSLYSYSSPSLSSASAHSKSLSNSSLFLTTISSSLQTSSSINSPSSPSSPPPPSSSSSIFSSTFSSSAPTLASSPASQSSSVLGGQNGSQQCPLFAQGAFKSGSSTGAPDSTGSSAALPTAPPAGCQRLAIVVSIVIGLTMGVIMTF